MEAINLEEKLGEIHEFFRHHVIADVNDHQVKLTKSNGEFIWHTHENEDEFFLVIKGRLEIRFRDHEVMLGPGEGAVVPKGAEHMTVAHGETHMLKFEPRSMVNTGNVESDRTTVDEQRI